MGLRPGRTNGKKAYERARKAGEFEHVPAADRREANKKFRNHPTGLRCTICGEYAPKLKQVRRADGAVVPGCASCAKARIPAFLDEPKQAVSQEWYAGWEILNRSGYQPVVLALPAQVPVSRAEWREIRRQLARMCGPRPRYIPTGAIHGMEVIALGSGDPQPPKLSLAVQRQRQPDEFCASHSGGGGFIRFEGDYHPWSWIRRNCVCSHCGARPSLKRSKVNCFGHYRGATYFMCGGPEHHLFERESDLAWRDNRSVNDEAARAWERTAVEKAFHWFYNPSNVADVCW